jgi:Na+-transporting NADH:ubiquinone oxidoreductase subunit C
MQKFSNTYIFMFSLIMVTAVAILLSFVAVKLKPMQQMNVEAEQKEDILKSVGQAEEPEKTDDKNAFIAELFQRYISETYVVDYSGDMVETDAFEIALNMKEQVDKAPEDRYYPVFVFSDPSGGREYIVPVRGKGLWGPIWGYVAFGQDLNTISGAVFDHQGETPGLGAEINTEWFQERFVGKTIFNEQGEFVSIDVVKGGAPEDAPHSVDAISGGTITSNGLEEMLNDCLAGYVNHFKSLAPTSNLLTPNPTPLTSNF